MSALKGTRMAAEKVLKIGSRLEFFPGAAELGASSRIEDIANGRIMAAMPMTDKGVPIIPEQGEKMLCRAAGDGFFYRFMTTYLDKGRDGAIPVWYVKMPEEVEKVQSREFVRVPADFPLIMRPLDEFGAMQDMIITRLTNISGGGICISHDKEMKVDSKVILEMMDLPGVGMMRVTGEIRRCSQAKNAASPTYQIGIKFMDLSKIQQNRLVKFIFELQRKTLAKGVVNK